MLKLAAQLFSIVAIFAVSSNATASRLPTRIGDCVVTKVKSVDYRLEGEPESGSAISFENRGYLVSYDRVPGIEHSVAGDVVKMCLIGGMDDCPPDTTATKDYRVFNYRTGETWGGRDFEHLCY